MPETIEVHLLDCGPQKYGDALLVRLGDVSILVDGAHPGDWQPKDGHPGMPAQLEEILGGEPPYPITLLIVSHAHQDHIGCLPRLVDDNVIRVDWALLGDPDHGWGRDPAVQPVPGQDARTGRVIAALREEPFDPHHDGDIEEFLTDASTLLDKYERMIETLDARSTNVVYYGWDDHQPLIDALAVSGVGLQILGPSLDQLALAAAALSDGLDAMRDGLELHFASDSAATDADAYRKLISGLDASRQGNLVNLQSLVTAFEYDGKKLLLTGDMQFVDPGAGWALREEVNRLRQSIEEAGPFDFAKLAHHGSDNAVDGAFLDEVGAGVVGICAGEHSKHHPSRGVLEMLEERDDGLQWLRTDRYGRCTIDLSGPKPKLSPKDAVNDARPNDTSDEAHGGEEPTLEAAVPLVGEARTAAPRVRIERTEGIDFVEVTARVPLRRATVTLTIDVSPRDGDPAARIPTPIGPRSDLAGLTFVSNTRRLEKRIGAGDAEAIVAMVEQGGGKFLDVDGNSPSEIARSIAARHSSQPRGVVILGGHEVIPLQRMKAVPDSLGNLDRLRDPDDFIVWSDDLYGSADADEIPEIPVSRIPDAHDANLLRAALSAPSSPRRTKYAIRNHRRQFANDVYSRHMGGDGEARPLSSSPLGERGVVQMEPADAVYLMLHGHRRTGRVLSGESMGGDLVDVVDDRSVPDRAPGTVFTGACWGALTTQRLARFGDSASRGVSESLALTFLRRGTSAFVGCTGAHYSPLEPPFDYFGGPMHCSFWRHFYEGRAPAEALFLAKKDYVSSFPHDYAGRPPNRESKAIEFKIWRQFTCLGLGW